MKNSIMKYWLYFAVIVLASGCQSMSPQETPSPSDVTASAFTRGEISRFMFDDWAGTAIPVWTYVPEGVDISDAPILVMFHGAKRDPAKYLREWEPLAQTHGFVVVAPEYSKADFPKSAAYNLGHVFRTEGVDRRPERLWSFSAIEPLFDYVVDALDSNETRYTMFGHSAGAQFVHRYLYYKPDARVKRYLVANAGWYTLPDFDAPYPYGLKGAGVPLDGLESALGKDVVILVGDQDNDPEHNSLRRTPDAMVQGSHRFARGLYFHSSGESQASGLGVPFGWKISVVEGVAHSNGGMAKGAVSYID